jgi:hypothetical protein
MNQKEFTVEGYDFILSYMDKELLELQQEGRVRAFCVNYTAKKWESEAHTIQMLKQFENDFLKQIYDVISKNSEWYERFELTRNFDGGWTGGYDDAGRIGTLNADRCLVMYVRQ